MTSIHHLALIWSSSLSQLSLVQIEQERRSVELFISLSQHRIDNIDKLGNAVEGDGDREQLHRVGLREGQVGLEHWEGRCEVVESEG